MNRIWFGRLTGDNRTAYCDVPQFTDKKWQETGSRFSSESLVFRQMKGLNRHRIRSFTPSQGWVLAALALLIGASQTLQLRADENLFGYTYTADVLPKGKWELEQWVTDRVGKESGAFSATDFRTEFEHGFTDRLQGSIYLNYNYYYIHNAAASSGPLDNKNFFGINGTSSEWKYQLLSPFKDSFGFTLYLEPEYSVI